MNQLEKALLFTFAMHGLGILSMALCLLPGMPGGGTSSDSERIAYIASNPWIWRLGWLPWQLTALSDLLLAVALMRTKWIARVPALFTLIVTILAVIPDQMGQIAWITKGIHLAQTDPAAYLAYEKRIFPWTAAWGATLYCVAALGWTWCFAKAKIWNRSLTILSIFLWCLFFTVCIGPFFSMNAKLVAFGNGVGFLLLQVWFVLVLEMVLRKSRRDELHGRYMHWRHPKSKLMNGIANSRFLRMCGEFIPPLAMDSDITNVVYVNYIVEAKRVERFVPEGLELQRIGPDKRFALFTFLTFRHGSFGPRIAGPFRRLLPSPVQTNWRIHVRDPRTGKEGIYFLTNAITSMPHALSARTISEGMPMHVLKNGDVTGERVYLDPGDGSAPDCDAQFQRASIPLDGPWCSCFEKWEDFLAYAVPQDRAFSSQPWFSRITRQEIDLGIPLNKCVPLQGTIHSKAAEAIAGDAEPFCFLVPDVKFRFESEEYDPFPPTPKSL